MCSTTNRDRDCAVAEETVRRRRTWRLRLAYRWLVGGESFEDLTAETGIDVEDLVRQLTRRKAVWRRIIRSAEWNGIDRAGKRWWTQ